MSLEQNPHSFSQLIKEKAFFRTPGIIKNHGPADAALIIGSIFNQTRKGVVKIYAHNLNGEISRKEDYLEELENFIVNGKAELQVIIDEAPQLIRGERNAYKLIKFFSLTSQFKNRVKIKVVRKGKIEEVKSIIKHALKDVRIDSLDIDLNDVDFVTGLHFATSSEHMYRFETNKSKHEADACFMGDEFPKKLSEIFDEIFTRDDLVFVEN